MATEKQIAANRLNAQKSTGPRTAEGKARVARNALRDGFYSKALVILPGFEPEFQHLRDQLLQSFKPDGAVQDALFDEILIASWNLRRAAFAESEVYQEHAVTNDPNSDPLTWDCNDAKFRRIRQFARHNQLLRDRAIKQLSEIQTEIRERLQSFPPDQTAGVPIADQMPHSFSVLCKVGRVVTSMQRTAHMHSAPLQSNKPNSEQTVQNPAVTEPAPADTAHQS